MLPLVGLLLMVTLRLQVILLLVDPVLLIRLLLQVLQRLVESLFKTTLPSPERLVVQQ